MYVDVGSANNVDSNSIRALIRRFDISSIPQIWSSGELFAHGMRNEAGLRFDKDDVLWGVENGCDDLQRPPWGDIHDNNPAEELNRFGHPSEKKGLFYGYPYCFTEYEIKGGKGAGTQWAHPNFLNQVVTMITGEVVTVTDSWCQNASNVIVPKFSMPAHIAPLDIIFYYGKNLPVKHGDAFVSWHGSWDRKPPQGYKVVSVQFEEKEPKSWENFFYYNQTGVDTGPNWKYRPVGLAFGPCQGQEECVFISSDSNGEIVTIVPTN